jgi:hypothetical protein
VLLSVSGESLLLRSVPVPAQCQLGITP